VTVKGDKPFHERIESVVSPTKFVKDAESPNHTQATLAMAKNIAHFCVHPWPNFLFRPLTQARWRPEEIGKDAHRDTQMLVPHGTGGSD